MLNINAHHHLKAWALCHKSLSPPVSNGRVHRERGNPGHTAPRTTAYMTFII